MRPSAGVASLVHRVPAALLMAHAASSSSFHGLDIPEGVEKRVLYHSSFRAIATYAMSLAELDRELQKILRSKGATVKEDGRRNLCGKLDVVTADNVLVHALTDTAGNTAFVQLKFWIDF